MSATTWFILAGGLLVLMALASTFLRPLPLSPSMLYLGLGALLGGAGWLSLDPLDHTVLLEHLAEVAVIVSLFTAGLKLRRPLGHRAWVLPVRLATVSMVVTVGLVAVAGHYLMGFSWGAAVLLAAVLAPTDPVLASDVQLEHPFDRDQVRFSLTGEAGLNDGTAFPFVMLGVGLLGVHDLGAWGWRWFAVDLVWAVGGGIGIGYALGLAVGRLELHLRRKRRETVRLDEFLTLGLIGLSYGVALLAHAYGFLAVFAAAVGLRQLELRHNAASTGRMEREEDEATSKEPGKASMDMTRQVLSFNEQLERIAEVALVVLLGATLVRVPWPGWEFVAFAAALFLVIRPTAVVLGLAGTGTPAGQQALTGWLGIRGVGSVYYLMYAVNKGVTGDEASALVAATLLTAAASIVVHGVSVTPLMRVYARRVKAREARRGAGAESR